MSDNKRFEKVFLENLQLQSANFFLFNIANKKKRFLQRFMELNLCVFNTVCTRMDTNN